MAENIYIIGNQSIVDIADAIRVKTGKSEGMTVAQMPQEILSIETGGSGNIMFNNIDCYTEGDTVVIFPPDSGHVYVKVIVNLFDEEQYQEAEDEFWIDIATGKYNGRRCTIGIDYDTNRITITPKSGYSMNYMDAYAYNLISESDDFYDLLVHLPDFHY